MHQARHKHGRRSYLSDGIGGDSHSLLEPEPLWSKDRGLFSYNIEMCTKRRMRRGRPHVRRLASREIESSFLFVFKCYRSLRHISRICIVKVAQIVEISTVVNG